MVATAPRAATIDGALLLLQRRAPSKFRRGKARLAPVKGEGGSVRSGECVGVENGGRGGLYLYNGEGTERDGLGLVGDDDTGG